MPGPVTGLRVLALDSAFGGLSAAVAQGDSVLVALDGGPAARAAEDLPGLVASALDASGLTLGQIDRIAVTLGPGGFTALRAGLAFAKGLGFGAGKPVLGFTTLEALACALTARAAGAPIVCAIDAKRDEVFLQAFSPDLRPLSDAMVCALDAAWARLSFDAAPPGIAICGSGAPALAARAPAYLAGVLTLHPGVAPDARALALHCQRFSPNERPADAVYLRPADARPSL